MIAVEEALTTLRTETDAAETLHDTLMALYAADPDQRFANALSACFMQRTRHREAVRAARSVLEEGMT